MSCEERTGFLFAHACDRPAAWSCVACGKAICFEHTRLSEAGNTCISCLRGQQLQQQSQLDEQRAQTVPSTPTHDPYFYDDDTGRSYDVDDYSAFDDDPANASASEAESDLGGS